MKFTHTAVRAALLSTISVASIGLASAAQAQDETVEATDAAAEEDVAFDEIIVTATRRDQAAQDVPLAVSVVAGEQLANAGIVDIRGIQQLAPSLKTTTGQSSATGAVLTIRGIGTAGDNPGFEPAVGVFIDGVFRSRAGVALAELPPIERVEVLRGPQGTLFGRNTSAGALSISTQKPKFEIGGYVEASYGNYDEIEFKAGVTGPVTEQLALRLDGGYHKRDGYITDVNSGNGINNLDRYFVRSQALFENEDVSFRLIADYAKTDEVCCGAVNTQSGFSVPLTSTDNIIARIATSALNPIAATPALGGAVGRVGTPAYTRGSRQMAVSPGRDLSEKVNEWGVSGELNWDFGAATLTSITAYRDWDARRNQDIDFSGVDRAYRDNYRTSIKDFSQEIRLQGTAFNDSVDWLVGGFYLNEKLTLSDTVRFGTQANQYVDTIIRGLTSSAVPGGVQVFGTLGPSVPHLGQAMLATDPVLLGQALGNAATLALFSNPIPGSPAGSGQVADNYRVKTDAIALFTHNIINFTDNLSLTLGLRYNRETKDIDANLNSVVPTCSFFRSANGQQWLSELSTNPAGLGAIAPAVLLLGCNPTVNSEFNGISSDSRKETEFTGTAKLSFKVNEDVLIYGGYDRGYKSGGYNLDRGSFDSVLLGGDGAQLTDLEFGNETVDSYEVGIKTNFSRQFQFNASLFHSNFKGYQSNRFLGNSFVVLNYDKLVSKGVELESIIRPHPDLAFNLGYTYVDAKVTDPLAGSDNGRQASNQPKHTFTGAVTWTPQISDGVNGLVHADFRQQSDAFPLNDPLARSFTGNDGFGIVNLRAGVNFGDGKYSVEGYVENLFNTYYNITAFPIPEQGSSFAVYPAPPRFYGVKLGVKF
ncbi:MAG: TonB-dependent receptor [Sphingomonadales bacterium]|nr:TonB-dependent receptor [Sphingomonadales bacterium]